MKRVIKGVLWPLFLAIVLGFICGKYVFRVYRNNLYDELSSSKLYLLENGEYDSIDVMRQENNKNNYVYYEDNGKYKTVVGITYDYGNIDKIKSLFNDNLLVYEYYLPSDKLDSKQLEYDRALNNTNDLTEIKKTVDNILEMYHDSDSIRLIQMN